MVSSRNKIILWARAGGRCEFAACNERLIGDFVSGKDEQNIAYVAHIVAEEPRGPRGDPVRSLALADDVNNLMLICDPHHRTIDNRANLHQYTEPVLLDMKGRHEARIEAVTAITEDRASHIVLFGARIGAHDFPVRFDLAKSAMMPSRYPASRHAIQLDMARLEYDDSEQRYWNMQVENLRRQFERKIREPLRSGDLGHISLFGLAPQPLLVELGRLFSDIAAVDVFQLHREPPDWRWREDRNHVGYDVDESTGNDKVVALKLALSATIVDDRIHAVLGKTVPIWALTTPTPHNDLMHRRDDLAKFRIVVRSLLDHIKARHGEDAVIHVFPALPVSAAIDLGRVWMPKADLPLVIYDQQRQHGFRPCLTLGAGANANNERMAYV